MERRDTLIGVAQPRSRQVDDLDPPIRSSSSGQFLHVTPITGRKSSRSERRLGFRCEDRIFLGLCGRDVYFGTIVTNQEVPSTLRRRVRSERPSTPHRPTSAGRSGSISRSHPHGRFARSSPASGSSSWTEPTGCWMRGRWTRGSVSPFPASPARSSNTLGGQGPPRPCPPAPCFVTAADRWSIGKSLRHPTSSHSH